MKAERIVAFLLLLVLVARIESSAQQNSFTGNYRVTTDEGILAIAIAQDEFDAVTGSMKKPDGNLYSMNGMVYEGIAAGVFSGNQGIVYFEAYLNGDDLTISLMEPDQFNMPDYNTVKHLVLSRSNQKSTGPQTPALIQTTPEDHNAAPLSKEPSSNKSQGAEVVQDEVNGFSFSKPEGWVHQQGDGQILLGSNTIPGLISVFPHQARNMLEMRDLMNQGIQEEGVYLALENGAQSKESYITGTYYGSVQGEQARGYGIGLLSPHGGGIFVLAVSTPQKLGKEIIAAADFLAETVRFNKPKTGDADLVKHFAGEWAWTNGYRTSWMTFFPDGTYTDQSEASYSGDMTDGSGNVTGNWGVAGQNSNRGRWSVTGNTESGVITVINPDGSKERYDYRVFVERGQKYYREYLFNGSHYAKQKDF